jgi:hypothetical protein
VRNRRHRIRSLLQRFVTTMMLALAVSVMVRTPAANAVSATEIGEVTFDLVVLRPLNTVAVALGSVFYVASAPLVWPFVGLDTSWDVFVGAPYEYTFERPLGDL